MIELITAMGLAAVLLALSVLPLRTFWFTQSLHGAADVVGGELRKQQEDSVSQSHPLVFGAGFTAGATEMILYSFNPKLSGSTDDTCSATARAFGSGLFNAKVVAGSLAITNDTTAPEYVTCQQTRAADKILFFYARGTSNGGTVVLEQPNVAKEISLSVSGISGRVTRT